MSIIKVDVVFDRRVQFLDCITAVAAIIWPIGSLPLILFGIGRDRKVSIVLFAMVLSFTSMYYIPCGDQYRFWEIYHEFPDIDWELFWSQPLHYLSLVYPIMYVLKSIGASFEFIRALFVFVCFMAYWSVGFLAYHNETVNRQQKHQLMSTLIILACIPFVQICCGWRYGIAICLLIKGTWSFYIEGKISHAILWIVLATAFHFSICVFIPIVFLLTNKQFLHMKILILAISSLFISYFVGEHVANRLAGADESFSYLSTYVEEGGEWRIGKSAEWSGLHLMAARMLPVSKVALMGLFLWGYRRCCKGKDVRHEVIRWLNLGIVLSVSYFCFCEFAAIQKRIEAIWLMHFGVSVLLLWGMKVFPVRIVRVVVCMTSVLFFAEFAVWLKPCLIGDIRNAIFATSYEMLCQTYDESFVFSNIDETGNWNL